VVVVVVPRFRWCGHRQGPPGVAWSHSASAGSEAAGPAVPLAWSLPLRPVGVERAAAGAVALPALVDSSQARFAYP
jgi:hypothetical protein